MPRYVSKTEARKYLTNTKTDGRVKYRVLRNGVFTGFFIAVPYSMTGPGIEHLQLGAYQLRFNHQVKTVEGWIPDEWLVDISTVEELELEADPVEETAQAAVEETAQAIALARASSLHMHIRFQQLRAGEHHAL